jgi:pimeloyl-ACP methyl ester carboxylesterase
MPITHIPPLVVIQAGDVGHLISRFIAKQYPSRCRAYHTNTPAPGQPDEKTHPELYAKIQATPLTDGERDGLARTGVFSTDGQGYYKQLSTRPQTMAYSLKDSPVGLLAWVYEKLHDWSDDYPWTDEEILTWISIYYFSTAGPDAASKVYVAIEKRSPSAFIVAGQYIDVPLGVTRFSKDLLLFPKLWNHSLGPIVYESECEGGGHFAAWEKPDAIIRDVRAMFSSPGSEAWI